MFFLSFFRFTFRWHVRFHFNTARWFIDRWGRGSRWWVNRYQVFVFDSRIFTLTQNLVNEIQVIKTRQLENKFGKLTEKLKRIYHQMNRLSNWSSSRDPFGDTFWIFVTSFNCIVNAPIIENGTSCSVHPAIRNDIVSIDDERMITFQHCSTRKINEKNSWSSKAFLLVKFYDLTQ